MTTFYEPIFTINVHHDGRLSQQIGGLHLDEAIEEMEKRSDIHCEAIGGTINGRRAVYSLAELKSLARPGRRP